MAFREPGALAEVLEQMEPSSPTACAGWTVHDIAAHPAAGAKEMADLVEEHLAGRPPDRPEATRSGRLRSGRWPTTSCSTAWWSTRAATSPRRGRWGSVVRPRR
jgi:Mycothiol maleylpyruvate isomerase N-terminal domain